MIFFSQLRKIQNITQQRKPFLQFLCINLLFKNYIIKLETLYIFCKAFLRNVTIIFVQMYIWYFVRIHLFLDEISLEIIILLYDFLRRHLDFHVCIENCHYIFCIFMITYSLMLDFSILRFCSHCGRKICRMRSYHILDQTTLEQGRSLTYTCSTNITQSKCKK